MNEQFLEIAKHAGLKFPSETALSPVEEKFAQMIVEECARVAAKNQAEDMGWNISEIILEHFGVE